MDCQNLYKTGCSHLSGKVNKQIIDSVKSQEIFVCFKHQEILKKQDISEIYDNFSKFGQFNLFLFKNNLYLSLKI